MRIERVHIKNFRAIEALDLPLHESLTVLHGVNGQGKTSVLSAIALGLRRIPQLLKAPGAGSFNASDVRIGHDGAEVTIYAVNGPHWSTLGISTALPAAQRKDLAAAGDDAQLRDVLKRATDAKEADEPADLPVVAFYDTERAVFGVPERRRDFGRAFTRLDAYDDALAAKSSFKALFDWFLARESDELRLKRDGGDTTATLPELHAVRRAITGMMGDVDDPHIEINPLRFTVRMRGAAGATTRLALDQLSGGYRIMLAMASDLARRMALANPHLPDALLSEAIVLIDEVELHLHPAWQQRVLTDLARTFPNTQFIVSTHSPQVLTTVRPEQIVRLSTQRGAVVALHETAPTFGNEAGNVLSSVMGVTERPASNPLAEKLRTYREMIALGDGQSPAARALRAELIQLSPNDPALAAADIDIDRQALLRDLAARS